MMRKQDNFLENILWLSGGQNQAMGPKYVVIKGNTVLYCFMIFRFSLPALPLEEVLIQQEREILCGWFGIYYKVKTYHSKT
jgi:hypothetical protein